VISRTTRRFRRCFGALPLETQEQAREAFRRFSEDPSHPGLRFKCVHRSEPIFSVRVSLDSRALAVREGDVLLWFWIGSHSDYEALLRRR
jgi:hypothetical protein